jgi:hypothetical protein
MGAGWSQQDVDRVVMAQETRMQLWHQQQLTAQQQWYLQQLSTTQQQQQQLVQIVQKLDSRCKNLQVVIDRWDDDR